MFDSLFGFSIIINGLIATGIYVFYMLEDHTDWTWVYQLARDLTHYERRLTTLLVGSTYYTCVSTPIWLLMKL